MVVRAATATECKRYCEWHEEVVMRINAHKLLLSFKMSLFVALTPRSHFALDPKQISPRMGSFGETRLTETYINSETAPWLHA